MRIGIVKTNDNVKLSEDKPSLICLHCKQPKIVLIKENHPENYLIVCINLKCFQGTDINKLETWKRK